MTGMVARRSSWPDSCRSSGPSPPFVAGVGRMNYGRFLLYNVVGGISWVLICLASGWLFNQIPIVRDRFDYVMVAIVFISVLPIAIQVGRGRWAARKGHSALVEGTSLEPTGVDEATGP